MIPISADNYVLIRKLEGKYVVTGEGASCPSPSPLYVDDEGNWSPGANVFDSYREARDYADDQWSEYGVQDLAAKEIHTLEPNSIYQFCSILEERDIVDSQTAQKIQEMMFDYLLWPGQRGGPDTHP